VIRSGGPAAAADERLEDLDVRPLEFGALWVGNFEIAPALDVLSAS
jgi:hypothetical protein